MTIGGFKLAAKLRAPEQVAQVARQKLRQEAADELDRLQGVLTKANALLKDGKWGEAYILTHRALAGNAPRVPTLEEMQQAPIGWFPSYKRNPSKLIAHKFVRGKWVELPHQRFVDWPTRCWEPERGSFDEQDK